MREFEVAIDEAFIKGLRPERRMRRGTPVLTECLGFRIGKYSIEGSEYFTDPIPVTVDMFYNWPFPQLIKGERYRFLIVRDHINMEDVVYSISADYTTAIEIFTIDELTFGRGTLMEAADFGEYAFMTNGVIMIYWDTTIIDWHEIVASATIPMMRTVCNFKGQMIGGCVLSDWHDCDETFVVWSKIGQADFTPGRRNEAGYRRDPFGGEIYHVRRLGAYVVVYSSKGITKMIPVSSPAATFGFEELHDVGLANRGAVAGNLKEHLFVDVDHYVWKLNEGGLIKLGYQEFVDNLTYGDILAHHDANKKDFYIGAASAPVTAIPTSLAPTTIVTAAPPTTCPPTTAPPTAAPTTMLTTTPPTTTPPTTLVPTSLAPTSLAPTTTLTTSPPTTLAPTSPAPTSLAPTSLAPTTTATTTAPTTVVTTAPPTTAAPTTIVTTLPPTSLAPTTSPPPPGNDFSSCLALWKFDENAVDSVGGNDLTPINGPSYSVDRMEGTHSADLYEADSEYFTIADADLDAGFPGKDGVGEQSFSICFWTKVNQLTEPMGFVNKYDSEGNTRSYKVWFDEYTGKIAFTIGWNGGASSTTMIYDTAITTGRWYHVGATYNASDNVFKLRIWDDTAGAFLNVGTPTQSDTAGGDMSSDVAPLEIGRFDESDLGCLDGHMDEVVFCGSVLTDDQIDCIRQQIFGVSCTTTSPTTIAPTTTATTAPPTTAAPTSLPPTSLPSTTPAPTTLATSAAPTTLPTTPAPTTLAPTTLSPTTLAPTTTAPTTLAPTTMLTTLAPTTSPPPMTVYYVRDDGNDGNTGLSDAQAWRTVTYANTQVGANDKLLFKCNDSWDESAIGYGLLQPAFDNMAFGAYYMDPTETEGISGSRPSITSDEHVFRILTNGIDDLTIEDLDLETTGAVNRRCVHFKSDLSSNLEIDNCILTSNGLVTIVFGCDGITITSNVATGGINAGYGEASFAQQAQNITATGNIVDANGSDGISTHSDDAITVFPTGTCVIRYNIIANAGPANEDGIDVDWDGAGSGWIEYNYIHGHTNQGINLGHGIQNCKVRWNWLDNNNATNIAGGQITVGDHTDPVQLSGNIEISYNLITGQWFCGIRLGSDGDNFKIYNNTFVQEYTSQSFGDGGTWKHSSAFQMPPDTDATNIEFKNNIVYWMNEHANSWKIINLRDTDRVPGSGATDVILADNLYHTANSNLDIIYVGNASPVGYTLAEAQAAPPVGFSTEVGTTIADPLFTDRANNDFTLAIGSPAIDVGTNLGAAYDDGLDPTSTMGTPSGITTLDQDPDWEKGAYVYVPPT